MSLALVASSQGIAAAGFWGLVMRYLKAPATLVGVAVSQALYPRLAAQDRAAGRRDVRRVMAALAALAAPLVLLLWAFAPLVFGWAFGPAWRDAGELARALALYIGLHFIASPLAVATMAWNAQAWALKLSLIGQTLFLVALALGLAWDGLRGAGWAVSAAMILPRRATSSASTSRDIAGRPRRARAASKAAGSSRMVRISCMELPCQVAEWPLCPIAQDW